MLYLYIILYIYICILIVYNILFTSYCIYYIVYIKIVNIKLYILYCIYYLYILNNIFILLVIYTAISRTWFKQKKCCSWYYDICSITNFKLVRGTSPPCSAAPAALKTVCAALVPRKFLYNLGR